MKSEHNGLSHPQKVTKLLGGVLKLHIPSPGPEPLMWDFEGEFQRSAFSRAFKCHKGSSIKIPEMMNEL